MGSVYVRWTGRCTDEEVRGQLRDKLRELAISTFPYFEDSPGLQNYYGPIEGRILISPSLLDGTELELPAAAHAPGGIELRAAGPLGASKSPSPEQFLTTGHVFLEGIAFRLYDGRQLYPGGDRISFVFADFEEYPALNGSLVYVEDVEQCKRYDNEEIRTAEAFLDSPNIHLRYYYEEWMDHFLGWVKHFFIPDLAYWRYEPNSGYERFQDVPRDEKTRDEFWELLKRSFLAEVEGKAVEAEGIREFWASVKPPSPG